MRTVLDLLYRLQRRLWKLLRPRTRGVKAMLFDPDGKLVLIRNSYGRSDLFVLPGGGIRPFEAPEDAARREVREELGCGVEALDLVSTHFTASQGKRDTIYLFRGRLAGKPVADGLEVEEVGLFDLGSLPPTVSPATRRRIAECRGEREPDGAW